jgi:hypothetical protein
VSEKGNLKNERMSVSDPEKKIEWGADSEPQKNERVPSSVFYHSNSHRMRHVGDGEKGVSYPRRITEVELRFSP